MTDKKVVIKAKAKTKSKRNAERPEIRIFNYGKFNNDTNGDKEVFRNLKSSSICLLKMERTSETTCKVFVGFVGYTNVEGDKKDDTFYEVQAVPLQSGVNFVQVSSKGIALVVHLISSIVLLKVLTTTTK